MLVSYFPSTSKYEEGWQLQLLDDGSSSCGWWWAGVPTGNQPWLSAFLCLRQEVNSWRHRDAAGVMIEGDLKWLKLEMSDLKRNVWRRAKRTHQLICPAELSRGASYSYTTLLCIFLPLSLSLCVSLSLCLCRVYLPLSVFPGGDIYQTSGQRLSLSTDLDQIYSGLRALFSALCFERGEGEG